MPTADDRTLLARFAATADQTAFAELVARHGPLVWGVCRRAVKCEPLAEEAFQAVFVVLARKAGALTLRTSLANWLFGVACRVSKRAVRRETRLKTREQVAVERAELLRAATARERQAEIGGPEWQDMLRVLDEELGRISEKHRGPLVACYLQGKTQDEAATDLGISIFKLRRRLAKARDILRLRLTRRGVTMAGVLFAGAVIADVGFAAAVPPATATVAVKAGLAAKVGGGVAAPVAALTAGAAGTGVTAWVAASVVAVALVAGALMSPRTTTDAPPDTEPTRLEVAPPPHPVSPEPSGPWVTLRGRVVWPGPLPEPKFANVTADRPTCCKDGPLADTALLIDPTTRGVRNVIVWLRPDTDDRRDTFPPDRAHPSLKIPIPAVHVIDQPKCQFEPRVVAAREGDSLVFKNSAPIAHNVSIASDYHDLNQTIPSGGNYRVTRPLVAEPLPLLVKCDVHPWMAGRVRVFDHPYFAVTDADGKFEMRRVPAGRWRVVYWHELGFHTGRAGAVGLPCVLTGDTTLPAVELKLPG